MNILKVFAGIGDWMTKDTANIALTIAIFMFLMYVMLFGW